jgi:hypothetical protein
MTVDLLVGVSKKGIYLDFWMFHIIKKFPRTLYAILYKTKWANIWGKIKPTFAATVEFITVKNITKYWYFIEHHLAVDE